MPHKASEMAAYKEAFGAEASRLRQGATGAGPQVQRIIIDALVARERQGQELHIVISDDNLKSIRLGVFRVVVIVRFWFAELRNKQMSRVQQVIVSHIRRYIGHTIPNAPCDYHTIAGSGFVVQLAPRVSACCSSSVCKA